MAQGDVTCDLTNALPKRCAVFDGVDDRVRINGFDITKFSGLTIIATIKKNGTLPGWRSIIGERSSYLYFGLTTEVNDSVKINVFKGPTDPNDRLWAECGEIRDGEWITFTGTYDCSTGRIAGFKNGKLYQSKLYTPAKLYNQSWFIDIAGNYPADVREIRIYNRAISQEEVTKLYNGLNVTDGLIHYWKLDKDYTDSVGDKDGTNSGSYLTTVDDQVATKIADARTTANDKYLISVVNDKVMTAVIEEA